MSRYHPDIIFKGGKFVTVMKETPDGAYADALPGGRPIPTDEFIDRLMASPISHQELPTALQAWVDKDWAEAMAILENYEALSA